MNQSDEEINRVKSSKEVLSQWNLVSTRWHMEAFCFPRLEALQTPSFCSFLEASLHRMIG